ncbi:MAG: SGNH/GDSL hydrolase family protein [Planctomycetota bacterium]|jgi:lysophospholipase L1-like esterase
MSHLTIVGFGDSITEATIECTDPADRWLDRVGRKLVECFPQQGIVLHNAGVGGNTTSEGLLRFDRDVAPHRPQFVTAEFGNDVTHEEDRHVTVEAFRANWETIRRRVVEELNAVLIVLVFPPVIDAQHQHALHPFHQKHGGLDRHEELYREVTRRFAAEYKLPVVDLDAALRTAAEGLGWDCVLLPDGIHLTAEGNRVVAEAVAPVLEQQIELFLEKM